MTLFIHPYTKPPHGSKYATQEKVSFWDRIYIMDQIKLMGSALVFKDRLHIPPVWEAFLKSCLQTLMVLFILVREMYLGRPSKVFYSFFSLSVHIKPILKGERLGAIY